MAGEVTVFWVADDLPSGIDVYAETVFTADTQCETSGDVCYIPEDPSKVGCGFAKLIFNISDDNLVVYEEDPSKLTDEEAAFPIIGPKVEGVGKHPVYHAVVPVDGSTVNMRHIYFIVDRSNIKDILSRVYIFLSAAAG